MISRKIQCKPENDDYGRLARYIADASHKGEKCLMAWTAGCWAGDDFALAIQEVEDTQDLNLRTTKEKTYHLIISFRPEDEAKLTPERFREIEKEFAKALGFEEHQRHCGVHKNTANIHMHVAYNMIHPERLTRHEPFRDYYKRDQVCRQLEKQFGLIIDNGRDPDGPPRHDNDKARTYEAHSGQQSFDGYVQERRDKLAHKLKLARAWQELHEILADQGMEIALRGNGCVIRNRFGKQQVKASALGREFSKARLEKRFGTFREARGLEDVPARSRYDSKPLHRAPERGQLYQEYRTSIDEKKQQYEAFRHQENSDLADIRTEWKRKQREIRNRPDLVWKDKKALISQAKVQSLKQEEALRVRKDKQRKQLRDETPYHNWIGFLKHKAETGDKVAMAILRSKNVEVRERDVTTPVQHLQGCKFRVDNQGNVLYTLTNGGMIKDMGKELFFSRANEQAAAVAEQLAWRKFGKNFEMEGNVVRRETDRNKTRGLGR
ncbi:TraI/MobA(P) family conjugative relaxase [Pseudodesulfovibrio tunisiensis]|uniref:TraI/MobA(P) family conjugative relaxase n=1 Tax=Pseudodesulfovibrio tunisiensis TaxID=463192 RepID=UPI001FB317CB|nr:TraI/MobA(P) family conjugative relaxase [Pseudodesulfovibrio tunisiensis]